MRPFQFAWLSLLIASTTLAAPRKPVVMLAPPGASPSLRPLALLVAARASELAEETNSVSELHLKQVLRAMGEEGFDGDLSVTANVEALRVAVGADRAVRFELKEVAGGLELSGVMVEPKRSTPVSLKLPAAWSAALRDGASLVAQSLLAQKKALKASTAQPLSSNDEALQQLGACYHVVLDQPLSAETPALVDTTRITAAAQACDQALKLDPTLRFAAAAGALAHAIAGTDSDATAAINAVADDASTLELSTLARFWLLTRYQSNEAGVAYLQAQVKAHPGELIAWAYLGDTQLVLQAWADAEQTFRRYTELAPASPWAWARLSKALARQNKHDLALAAAKKAFALSPTSPEMRLELGSRLIDSGQQQQAQLMLEPLASLSTVRGEHLLRLGWAHWLEGELEPAQAYFQRALDVATAPGEWRTRGRAHYDLALVDAKRGRTEAARLHLREAERTGFRLKTIDASLAPLIKDNERAELGLADAGRAQAAVLPAETSLFPINAAGDVVLDAPKKPKPEGLVLYRF